MAAASAPGIAADDTFYCEPCAIEKTMFFQGFDGVMGAGRRETADISNERRNA